jgi:hypothetical protein
MWEQNSKMCRMLFRWELIMRCSLPVCGWEIYLNNGGEFSIVSIACLVASEVCVRQRCDVSFDVWEASEDFLNILLFHNQECGTFEETEYKMKTLNRCTLWPERGALICATTTRILRKNPRRRVSLENITSLRCPLVIRIMTEMLNDSLSYRRGGFHVEG